MGTFNYIRIVIMVTTNDVSKMAPSILQVAQLSQRDRAAGWVSFGQKWKTVTGRRYFADVIGLSSTTVT